MLKNIKILQENQFPPFSFRLPNLFSRVRQQLGEEARKKKSLTSHTSEPKARFSTVGKQGGGRGSGGRITPYIVSMNAEKYNELVVRNFNAFLKESDKSPVEKSKEKLSFEDFCKTVRKTFEDFKESPYVKEKYGEDIQKIKSAYAEASHR